MDKLVITINENTIGIWFFNTLGGMGDVLCSLYKKDNTLCTTLRTRTYDPNDPGNDPDSGKDKKMWLNANCKTNDEQTELSRVRSFIKQINLDNAEVFEVIIDENGLDDFIDRFQKLPFVHITKVTSKPLRS